MDWQETGTLPARSLSAARLQLHFGAQVLGAAAHALLEHREDDGHTNLGVDSAQHSLYTHALVAESDLHLHLDLPTGALVFRQDDRVRSSLTLEGESLSSALDWAGGRASEWLGREVALTRREYSDFPESPLGSGAAFAPAAEAQGLELARWFGNARELLEGLRCESPGLSSVRVWPHHFDLGALLPLGASAEPMLGLGFSPGDGSYDQPYFYCSPYPQPTGSALPDLTVGHWHTQGFVSAVVTAEELQASPSQAEAARKYLSGALAAGRAILEQVR